MVKQDKDKSKFKVSSFQSENSPGLFKDKES